MSNGYRFIHFKQNERQIILINVYMLSEEVFLDAFKKHLQLAFI